MTFTYRHRKQIYLGLVVLFIILLISLFTLPVLFKKSSSKVESPKLVLTKTKKEEKEKDDTPLLFQVDIKGAVQNPGIYKVEDGSRVIDVIHMAGDLLENADTTVLNLSKKVFDEMVIFVYTKEEVANFKVTKTIEEQVLEKCREGEMEALENDACREEEQKESETLVSLNKGTIEDFLTLPGIGEAKANAIIKYREEHGSFQNLDELKEVSGIGESLFNQIKKNITL